MSLDPSIVEKLFAHMNKLFHELHLKTFYLLLTYVKDKLYIHDLKNHNEINISESKY